MDVDTTTPILYFTRWITHLCAPTFVFLSGVSIYLQSLRKTKRELSIFLVKHGLWLIFFECIVMTAITGFDLTSSIIALVVIWAIGISKYPPSLMYMCVMIGISFILISLFEGIRNKFTTVTTVFGRTALFYYAFHFLVLHIVLTIIFFINERHTIQEAIDAQSEFLFVMPGEGFSLGVVYIIWAILVASLYPVCRWYDQYKTNHKEKRWLSYL